MSVIDVGGEVREGEELDIGAVENWLKIYRNEPL